MWYVVAGVLVLLVVGVLLSRGGNTPSRAMFGLIDRGVRKLQAKALRNVFPEQQEHKVTGFNVQRMQNQTITLQNVIRFVYTVERQGDAFLHIVSSQLTRRKSRKYHAQCTAVVMLVLTRQLVDLGVKQEDVEFGIEESETGTQYVCMLLDPGQHRLLADNVLVGSGG